MPVHRRGSIFLLVLGLTTLMVVLAFTFIIAARLRREQGLGDGASLLAQQAARGGVGHAIEVLTRDFLASPNRASSFGSRWFQAFGAIDSGKEGKEGWNPNGDDPMGHEDSPFDRNENDVKSECRLIEMYIDDRRSGGNYRNRRQPFLNGWYTSRGLARWIEPCEFHRDLQGKPISFHLTHPAPANAGSSDPALWRGENYLPDVDQPMWYDVHLLPVDDRTLARFRLRYAVCVEDLGGHLLSAPQGEYVLPVRQAPASVPTAVDAVGAAEIDPTLNEKYADAFVNLSAQSPNMLRPWVAALVWRGQGVWSDRIWGESTVFPAIASFSGTVPAVWGDYDNRGNAAPIAPEPDDRITQAIPDGGTAAVMSAAGRQVRYTFDDGSRAHSFAADTWNYLMTPFARTSRAKISPTRFDDGYTDVPWQVNVLTAPARTITSMVFAYLPKEAQMLKYRDFRQANWGAFDPVWGSNSWNSWSNYNQNKQVAHPHVDLFSSPSFVANYQQPYPGSAPYLWNGTNPTPASDTPPVKPGGLDPNQWNEFLGAGYNINDWWRTQPSDLPDNRFPDGKLVGAAYSPLQGCWGRMYPEYPYEATILEQPFAGGIRIDVNDYNVGAYLDWTYGMWYTDSYWYDLAQALTSTIALTQYAHQSLDGSQRLTSANPDGIPRWPNVPGDSDYAGRAGTPMLDTDRDGDGVNDTPSQLASIAAIDRQFVKNLGEYPEAYATGSRPSSAHVAITCGHTHYNFLNIPAVTVYTPSANIKRLLGTGTISLQQAKLMELALNDLRMSFFGASGQYPDFAGIDFDDDGVVQCSGYTGKTAPAGSTGYGPIVPVAQRISLTGCFVMQQSRFFRIIVRGQLFDELRHYPVAEANLETVYAIDPSGRIYDVNGAPSALRDPNHDGVHTDTVGMSEGRILFQRWLMNAYQGDKVRSYP